MMFNRLIKTLCMILFGTVITQYSPMVYAATMWRHSYTVEYLKVDKADNVMLISRLKQLLAKSSDSSEILPFLQSKKEKNGSTSTRKRSHDFRWQAIFPLKTYYILLLIIVIKCLPIWTSQCLCISMSLTETMNRRLHRILIGKSVPWENC